MGATVLLIDLAATLWERACPANTGEAGAMHRVAPFAGQARSHNVDCPQEAGQFP
jgi:hypothetical protein